MGKFWTAVCLFGVFGFWLGGEWALGMLTLLLGSIMDLHAKVDRLAKPKAQTQDATEEST